MQRVGGGWGCVCNALPCRRTYANFWHVQTCCNLIKIKFKITNTAKYAEKENENVVQVLDTNRRLVARLFTGSARQTKSNSWQPEAKCHSNRPPSLPSSRGRWKGVGSRVQLSRVIWGQQPHRHPHTRALNCQGSQYAACSMQTECSMNGGCALSHSLPLSPALWQLRADLSRATP